MWNSSVCFYVLKIFLKKFKIFLFYFYFKLIFFIVFLDHFEKNLINTDIKNNF
jgi:hypothetical protein